MTMLLEKFNKNFAWNISGSVLFEILKLIHNVLLFHSLPHAIYGSMGSIFALIYFCSRLIESGAAYSIPPFFYIMQTKEQFKKIFLRYYIFPLIPIGISISLLFLHFYNQQFSHTIYIVIFPALMILEAIRSTLRQFLHTAFKSKYTIIAELLLFVGYLVIVWGGHYLLHWNLTLNYLFIPYLLDSIMALLLFSWLIQHWYKTLPLAPEEVQQKKTTTFASFYIPIRLYNFLLKTSRDLFTSNFITPLFAIKFGLVEAGIFYFASTLATAAQAVIRASIGYTGSALLANVKNQAFYEKKEAFNELSKKLTQILIPTLLVIAVYHQKILSFGFSRGLTTTTLLFALLYFFIVFSEFFFILYEQFYLVEEASKSLFFFKAIEFTLFFLAIFASAATNPITLLTNIVTIRVFSFSIIAINAYLRWKIRPKLHVTINMIIALTAVVLAIKGICLIANV